mmetsp:Transcript_22649/g.45338  ORF Transcript_22649/g.45338 Transcript_22649/m.45338 type:complete len:190 (-) Transcript_22649:375-944(-)
MSESSTNTIKAWISSSYGKHVDPADAVANLKLANDVPVPKPGKGEFLIKISHTTVNPIDWKLFSGGLHGICLCTHPYTPGFDFAGTVVELGSSSEDSSKTFSVNNVVCCDISLVETCTNPPTETGVLWHLCGVLRRPSERFGENSGRRFGVYSHRSSARRPHRSAGTHCEVRSKSSGRDFWQFDSDNEE